MGHIAGFQICTWTYGSRSLAVLPTLATLFDQKHPDAYESDDRGGGVAWPSPSDFPSPAPALTRLPTTR
jgi:hypothetical protein